MVHVSDTRLCAHEPSGSRMSYNIDNTVYSIESYNEYYKFLLNNTRERSVVESLQYIFSSLLCIKFNTVSETIRVGFCYGTKILTTCEKVNNSSSELTNNTYVLNDIIPRINRKTHLVFIDLSSPHVLLPRQLTQRLVFMNTLSYTYCRVRVWRKFSDEELEIEK
ncbi:hypothetical protein K501DRAFT_274707 [Backusella circina FSU 941]|nr:hypothetical protein K501DRAFT_274707 [Backusella circina FSU 941]